MRSEVIDFNDSDPIAINVSFHSGLWLREELQLQSAIFDDECAVFKAVRTYSTDYSRSPSHLTIGAMLPLCLRVATAKIAWDFGLDPVAAVDAFNIWPIYLKTSVPALVKSKELSIEIAAECAPKNKQEFEYKCRFTISKSILEAKAKVFQSG